MNILELCKVGREKKFAFSLRGSRVNAGGVFFEPTRYRARYGFVPIST